MNKLLVALCCALGLWAASASGEADLKVGILSDVHLSPPEKLDSQGAIDTFRRALTLFREEKVDAVVIAGDLSNNGTMTDLRVSAGVWNEVFGRDAATPVKVFVTGNHERGYFEQAKRKGDFKNPGYADGLHLDVRKNWKELYGEEWTPFFLKQVKGYAFVGAHWGEWRDEAAFRAFLSANRDKLGSAKPFFYVQHDQPLGTCFGDWYRGDGPVVAKVLADYPNAVVFSGHTHYSISDPRAVWQGAFTSVCAASLRWLELVPGGAEDVAHRGEKYKRVIPDCWWEPQGLIMSVRGERMVFARYDLLNMEKLGADWSVPVLHGKDDAREFAFDRRRVQSEPPQFAAGAAVTVSEREGKKGPEIVVGFPSAVGADELSRAFDYEVVGECGEGTNRTTCVKRVFQPGVQLNVKRLPPRVECPFLKSELPSAPRRFRVTPMNAFGLRGGTLATGVSSGAGVSVDVRKYGVCESDLLQTAALQAAIDAAADAGGGEVVIPAGRFLTGGLVLKSGVTIRLEDGAELSGDRNADNYPGTNRWYRGLIRADGAHDIGIVGGRHSCIDGENVYDPRGEENYRGPHGILLIGCTNVTLRGYTVRDSANWAHALFQCGNVRISDVRVFGGHDALDFHDSTDVTVENCELRTGDDCVAGFANFRCRVRDCVLDTSCQAFRLGGADIVVERCRVVHPSSFGHRYGLPPELKKSGALAGERCRHGIYGGVIYYCDSRWAICRPQRDIVFRDCTFERPRQIFALSYDGRNMWCCQHPLESIAFKRCVFTGVTVPIAIYGDEERPLDLTLRDCTVTAAPEAADRELLTAYHYGRITLENVKLEGFKAPHLVTRSKGEVVVKGGTPVANVFRPDPMDRTLTFAECAAELAKLPGDDAGWKKWLDAQPTPPESRWSEEKGLYVTDDPLVVDVWGSALAVLRGETPHVAQIARKLCRSYQYYVGWGRTGMVKPNLTGELSPLPAGAFGYAMAQFDPLFARTFFTDFIRSESRTPAAVSGARQAVAKLLKEAH